MFFGGFGSPEEIQKMQEQAQQAAKERQEEHRELRAGAIAFLAQLKEQTPAKAVGETLLYAIAMHSAQVLVDSIMEDGIDDVGELDLTRGVEAAIDHIKVHLNIELVRELRHRIKEAK